MAGTDFDGTFQRVRRLPAHGRSRSSSTGPRTSSSPIATSASALTPSCARLVRHSAAAALRRRARAARTRKKSPDDGVLRAGLALRGPARHASSRTPTTCARGRSGRWRRSPLHEAVPGHHLQIALAQELDGRAGLPAARLLHRVHRGLGLYAESLGDGDGLLPGSATRSSASSPTRCGGPSGWWWTRACTRWAGPGSRPSTSSPRTPARPSTTSWCEVDRYIVWPAQALGLQDRASSRSRSCEARAVRGPGRCASTGGSSTTRCWARGAAALDVLEARLDAWVARKLQEPVRP